MMSKVEPSLRDRSRSSRCRPPGGSRQELWPRLLNPDRLPDHIDQLYRTAWALCGSQHDAEDLRQEASPNVTRPLFDHYTLPINGAAAMTTKVATLRPAEVERAQLPRQYGARAQRAEQLCIAPPTAHPASASAIGDALTW